MTFLVVSFIAGVLTVLAPCILPLLPVVIGSSVGARSKLTPFIVIGSLAVSILLFTYLLKASTVLIEIPTVFWSYLSGGILTAFGLILFFPKIWESLPFIAKASANANQVMGAGYQKKSLWGDVIIGASLGPIFSTCSPTYLVILSAVLPASFWLGTTYLIAYILGLVFILGLIALLGQKLTTRLQSISDNNSWFKRGLGIVFILIGIAIMTGFDKKVESEILNTGFLNISIFEQKILDSVLEDEKTSVNIDKSSDLVTIKVPKQLNDQFTTDWTKANPKLEKALHGGPKKDGIPAIDEPEFIPINNFHRSDSIQAIVLTGEKEVKVYPYNILVQHEIANDEIDGKPVAVTFCPLCGSAIVYNRTLPDGQVSTFGVSGSLLESNMIMYDRITESLWQQSTGEALAGSFYPNKLNIEPFQLMTIGEVKKTYPEAIVLSEETGHFKNYGRDPYPDYETSDQFIFNPSDLNTQFPPKTIMAVFLDNDSAIAVPWLELRKISKTKTTIDSKTYDLSVSETGELQITDESGTEYPFYFEMWFSYAVQHSNNLKVIEL